MMAEDKEFWEQFVVQVHKQCLMDPRLFQTHEEVMEMIEEEDPYIPGSPVSSQSQLYMPTSLEGVCHPLSIVESIASLREEVSGPRGRPPTVVHEQGVDHESRASWY